MTQTKVKVPRNSGRSHYTEKAMWNISLEISKLFILLEDNEEVSVDQKKKKKISINYYQTKIK